MSMMSEKSKSVPFLTKAPNLAGIDSPAGKNTDTYFDFSPKKLIDGIFCALQSSILYLFLVNLILDGFRKQKSSTAELPCLPLLDIFSPTLLPR